MPDIVSNVQKTHSQIAPAVFGTHGRHLEMKYRMNA